MLKFVLLLFAIVCATCQPALGARSRLSIHKDPVALGAFVESGRVNQNAQLQYHYDQRWYTNMPIDHFSYRNTQTFSLRYLTNFTYYQAGGPIFFYTGNEGSIDAFANNTGIMWDLAPLFKAAIVFAEHRFYGQSMPFGNESYSVVSKLGYLNSQQALADYATLIPFLKSDVIKCPPDTPVIAFGGSYGGVLAAWLRIKYPQTVVGAWSSSAPLLYFIGGGTRPSAFSNITTRTFVESGCDRTAISEGLEALIRLGTTGPGRAFLNQLFVVDPKSLIESVADAVNLYSYVDMAISYMAMTDYPYPSNFLKEMPGWPVKHACQFARQMPNTDEALVEQLYHLTNVYYNYTGRLQSSCFSANCQNAALDALGSPLGWPWQECTELAIIQCDSGGQNDFFVANCATDEIASFVESCMDQFEQLGYTPGLFKRNAVSTEYGVQFGATSNIVFTNGYLDPWSSGGVYENSPGIGHAMRNGVHTLYINSSAHHLDLRQPNTCDPPSVVSARLQIVEMLKCWTTPGSCATIAEHTYLPTNSDWQPPSQSACAPEIFAYPWNDHRSMTDDSLPA